MRTNIAIGLAAILVSLSALPAAAQAPAESQDSGGQVNAGGGLLIDRIDPERLRQIRTERIRQYILGAGLMAAGALWASRSRIGSSRRGPSASRSPLLGWRRSSSR